MLQMTFFHKEIKSEDRSKRYSHGKKCIGKCTQFCLAPLLTMVPQCGYLRSAFIFPLILEHLTFVNALVATGQIQQ